MNTLLLTPTDTLFFRDGRPMGSALAGHGAAWPLPTVANAALHAALHDASRALLLIGSAHHHDHMRGATRHLKDARAFGSLTSAGPFPVSANNTWYYPRPLDLAGETLQPSLVPRPANGTSSLSETPLTHTLVSNQPPTKDSAAKAWLSAADYTAYLRGSTAAPASAVNDDEIYLAESTVGIAIDPSTSTAGQGDAAGKIYSAHSLRLRESWCLGLLAKTDEKQGEGRPRRDLISQDLYSSGHGHLILGGQQRVCQVSRPTNQELPLPRGLTRGFSFDASTGKHHVKWVLLSPAIFPAISAGISKRGTERKAHRGGWLPTWIDPQTCDVLLEIVDEATRRERRRLNYKGQGYASAPNISARLVAARIDKPVAVTGWANGDDSLGEESRFGAKSTHLAVPAGSVYYFSCDKSEQAEALAAALNWHGADPASCAIRNRRSTLLGEKGFGIGVCGTWEPAGLKQGGDADSR